MTAKSWSAYCPAPIIGFQLFLAAVLSAEEKTSPGRVTLLSTFECMSVRAKYSGDDNENNSATIQWRKLGRSWKDLHKPFTFIDR